MNSQEILNQQQNDQILPFLKQSFSNIYKGNSKQVSYSDAYNCIYKLCKKGMAEDILKQLNTISESHFTQILSELQQNGSKVTDFLEMINKVNEAAQRISEILLYIQSNYFVLPKRQHNSVKQLLNSVFFTQLCQHKQILSKMCEQISNEKINKNQIGEIPVIEAIHTLDQKQIFLVDYFIPVYFNKMSQHYRTLFEKNYSSMQLKQFLNVSRQCLKQERQWLKKHFLRTKGRKPIEQFMKKLYQSTFEEIKNKIYQQKKQELFKKVTQQFLEILNEKNQEKEINNFNDWYINQIKKRMMAIDRSNNEKFLQSFIYEYLSISNCLADIKKFNINYRATFFLEHWINEDKVHLPKRLNVYFEDLIQKNCQHKDAISNFNILFKFLKEKDFFQKQFRRACALRMIYDKTKSDSQIQNQVIEQMKNQCGTDWIQKLLSIKAAASQSQSDGSASSSKFKAIVFQDTSWPFQKVKSQAVIPKQLLVLSGNFKQQYAQKFKGRQIQWHPFQGFVVLNIKFNKCNQQFKMDTVMATIMMNLQESNFKANVKAILDKTNLPIQEATQQFELLQKQGIIEMAGAFKLPQAYHCQVQLNLEYRPKKQCSLIDFTQRFLQEEFLQKNGHQQLKAQRKMMVEAFIVKIMKLNKTISKQEMYEQITPMIQNRGFKFSQQFVDNCFQVLIDKRYIRSLENGNYSYLAS